MIEGAHVAVVVPAYNEESLIGRTVQTIPDYVDDIWIVDDGSRDQTFEIAKGFTSNRVHLVRHGRNRGVGAAIATGYAKAFAMGSDAVAVMAGDAQMDPADLEGLFRPVLLGQADYAKGNRLAHPQSRRAMPVARWIGNHVLSTLTRLCTGLHIGDSQCGYTVLSRRAFERLQLEQLWPRYGYPNDLLAMAGRAELRVMDVTVRPIYGTEKSGVGPRHALFVVPWILLRAVLRRRSPRFARTEPVPDR
ncbi:MAG: glycosyltransferase family 2 protein [Myxococcales bacterium]|nr:glycosyltransferase family 2 protein [Myxococcales bacterium]